MMSKKTRKISLDRLPHDTDVNAKARFRHQMLIQDYEVLLTEVEETRSKLETGKKRKFILLGEVRFLRQRFNYLNNKSADSIQHEDLVLPRRIEAPNKKMKNQVHGNVQASHNLPPRSVSNRKGRANTGKVSAPRKAPPAVKQKKASHSRKVGSLQNLASVICLNHGEKICDRNDTALESSTWMTDLNNSSRIYCGNNAGQLVDSYHKKRTQYGKETSSGNRAPMFDLNEISREEEIQNYYKEHKLEELKNSSNSDRFDEQQLSDLTPICRNNNIGESSNQMGKQKISWQFPFAVKV